MRASGNGAPALCVANLLRTIRGEVPFERLKGIDSAIIDAPAASEAARARTDIAWLLKTYEPRFDVQSVDLSALAAEHGAFEIRADGGV
jgi:phage baseplate assembly protein W